MASAQHGVLIRDRYGDKQGEIALQETKALSQADDVLIQVSTYFKQRKYGI